MLSSICSFLLLTWDYAQCDYMNILISNCLEFTEGIRWSEGREQERGIPVDGQTSPPLSLKL